MINTALTPEAYALYRRIADLPFDVPDTEFTFVKRLAQENAWTEAYAERVLEEYRRFLVLTGLSESPISPSDAVDQVWHLHLTYQNSSNVWTPSCTCQNHGLPGNCGPGLPWQSLSSPITCFRCLSLSLF